MSLLYMHYTLERAILESYTIETEKNSFVIYILFLRAIYVVVTYFVVGALINKFYRKASGKDIIPHREFWFQLPILIKVN